MLKMVALVNLSQLKLVDAAGVLNMNLTKLKAQIHAKSAFAVRRK